MIELSWVLPKNWYLAYPSWRSRGSYGTLPTSNLISLKTPSYGRWVGSGRTPYCIWEVNPLVFKAPNSSIVIYLIKEIFDNYKKSIFIAILIYSDNFSLHNNYFNNQTFINRQNKFYRRIIIAILKIYWMYGMNHHPLSSIDHNPSQNPFISFPYPFRDFNCVIPHIAI